MLGRKSCVLVVDDEQAVRRVVTRVLKNEGHAVLEAGDGADALELLEGEACCIDLVLTDVTMPRVGGLELGRHIAMRQLPVPVLYMSADPPDTLLAGASSSGIPACLQKPFSMVTLVAIVERLLNAGG